MAALLGTRLATRDGCRDRGPRPPFGNKIVERLFAHAMQVLIALGALAVVGGQIRAVWIDDWAWNKQFEAIIYIYF